MASTPAGDGQWTIASDGRVATTGSAVSYGDLRSIPHQGDAVGIAPTASGHGYWLVASDGGVFSFGDATFHGSTGAFHLNKPIVGMTATVSGNGYWLVASDGGVFAFGDAAFHGSTGAMRLNRPVVGIVATKPGNGYWLVGDDGGVFSFGDAPFFGSGPNQMGAPVIGIYRTTSGDGYWLLGQNGQVLRFGDAPPASNIPGKVAAGTVNPTDGDLRISTPAGHVGGGNLGPVAPDPTPDPTPPVPVAPDPTPDPTPPVPGGSATPGSWESGASGNGVSDGSFAAWRGRPLDIVSTWADDNVNQVNLWQCQPGGEYANWRGDLDVAIGAIGSGESWQAAASGAYDARWAQSLTALRDYCASHARTVYIRFAHEMNGNWYPWSVNNTNYQAFDQAWIRFRNLQKQIFPAGKLVFSVNRESVGTNMDWRTFFPGAQNVDVLDVDYYNQYPYAGTVADFNAGLQDTDGYGAPKGLEKHRQFAASVGLPLAVSEWSGNADNGDSPAFIQGMHDFFANNGGTGAGRLLYETVFNVDKDNRNWILYPFTRMTASATTYQQLW